MLFSARRARGRTALSIAGIALGVALGYGVHLVNRAAVSDVAAAVRSLAGEADLEVRGGRAGFPEALYPRIARLAGVALASPALELQAGIAGGERTIALTGIDILRAAILQPQLVTEDRGELLAPDRVLLSTAAAAALGLAKGDVLQLVNGQQTIALKVAGIASSLRGISALTDIATAQWRFGRLGQLNRIDVRLKPGTDLQGALKRIGEAAAARRACRVALEPGGGERLSVALVSREPQRARHGGALHRRLPGVLGAGAGNGAAPRRARAAAGAGPEAATGCPAGPRRGGVARRDRRRPRPRARLRAGARRGARFGRGSRRGHVPRRFARGAAFLAGGRRPTDLPASSSRCWARCFPRSTRRAPPPRGRSKLATSRRCSSASRRRGPASCCWPPGAALSQLGSGARLAAVRLRGDRSFAAGLGDAGAVGRRTRVQAFAVAGQPAAGARRRAAAGRRPARRRSAWRRSWRAFR